MENLDFIVSCKHVSPTYCRDHIPVTVKVDKQGNGQLDRYYVYISGFGCSKSYGKPQTAIICMLQEHACTGIQVREVAGHDIEAIKAREPRMAGRVTRRLNLVCSYGCHYGMRSTYEACKQAFYDGWAEQDAAIKAETKQEATTPRKPFPREVKRGE
jgi:hypothetical protein